MRPKCPELRVDLEQSVLENGAGDVGIFKRTITSFNHAINQGRYNEIYFDGTIMIPKTSWLLY